MYKLWQALSQHRIYPIGSVFISLNAGRDGVAVDAAAGEPGLNAPCTTLCTFLCVKDIIVRVSEAHSRYEPLPSKDLRPLIAIIQRYSNLRCAVHPSVKPDIYKLYGTSYTARSVHRWDNNTAVKAIATDHRCIAHEVPISNIRENANHAHVQFATSFIDCGCSGVSLVFSTVICAY